MLAVPRPPPGPVPWSTGGPVRGGEQWPRGRGLWQHPASIQGWRAPACMVAVEGGSRALCYRQHTGPSVQGQQPFKKHCPILVLCWPPWTQKEIRPFLEGSPLRGESSVTEGQAALGTMEQIQHRPRSQAFCPWLFVFCWHLQGIHEIPGSHLVCDMCLTLSPPYREDLRPRTGTQMVLGHKARSNGTGIWSMFCQWFNFRGQGLTRRPNLAWLFLWHRDIERGHLSCLRRQEKWTLLHKALIKNQAKDQDFVVTVYNVLVIWNIYWHISLSNE